ncbi:MAG: AAA family ATPase, partial [Actinomycetia bacterium]|nr:AAA family ATPase [Actinomycetes bacterium]
MLERLKIKDYILVNELEIHFSSGLNILTGETGAGKSILIESISILFGARTGKEIIRKGASRAYIEGTFHITDNIKIFLDEKGIDGDDELLIIKREIRADGSTRGFINSSNVTISLLKETGSMLLDIHGQHAQQSLLNNKKHLTFLDLYAGTVQQLEKYSSIFKEYNSKKKTLEALSLSEQERERKKEILEYTISEIEKAEIKKDEDIRLEEEQKIISNAITIKETAEETFTRIREIYDNTSHVIELLEKIREFDEKVSPMIEPARESYYYIEDISDRLSAYRDSLDFDPSRLEEIDDRLKILYELKNKYGPSLDSVIENLEKSRIELENIDTSLSEKNSLEKEIEEIKKQLIKEALLLSKSRKLEVRTLESSVGEEL